VDIAGGDPLDGGVYLIVEAQRSPIRKIAGLTLPISCYNAAMTSC
jgi:hypothetical protein